MRKVMALHLLLFCMSFFAYSEADSIFLDFRNQKISDIIYALADVCEESVFVDDTITGIATFHFEDSSFESALNRFADHCHFYITIVDGIYYVSKIKYEINSVDNLNLNTENVNVEKLLIFLSRITETTILYDSLPSTDITIRINNASLEDVLNLVLVKLPGFGLERVSKGYYLTKSSASTVRKNVDIFTISEVDGEFSLNIQRAEFTNLIETLFEKGGKEYSLLSKVNTQLTNISFKEKDFDTILDLILESVNCDYVVEDGVYRIFEIQKKDITKKYKNIQIITLENMSTERFMQIIPSELTGAASIKTDKTNNSIIVSGSRQEVEPIIQFVKMADVKGPEYEYKVFEVSHVPVKQIADIIPKDLLVSEIIILPDQSGFITQTDEVIAKRIENFVESVDIDKGSRVVDLKYIRSEELLKSLPSSIKKDCITQTENPNLVFFNGPEKLYQTFLESLEVIDVPKKQIKYQLLVIQREKTNGQSFGTLISANSTSKDAGYSWSGKISDIFNINFDIISLFGVQFAGSLNAELKEGKAHVLTDTTLNGISGESISFSNTNTFRYLDKNYVINTGGDLYTTTTIEISSGLMLNINGWVSGDDMVTVKIDAEVSKQGTASSVEDKNLPSTSEKKVSTNVRTKSGEPVIIGGLFQIESEITEKKTPILGSIPMLGNLFKSKSENKRETEFIIYLVPYAQNEEVRQEDEEENLKRLEKKYSYIFEEVAL